MNYLDLVNLVITESGSELDELTSITFDSDFAGKRLYPRLKRYVAEAWKTIQIRSNQWEFKAQQYSGMVYPRFKYQGGNRAAGTPTGGTQFEGADSGFIFTVRQVLVDSGTWAGGDATGQIEFEIYEGNTRILPGEVFDEVGVGDGMFTYLQQGSYDFGLSATDLLEVNWTTVTSNQGRSSAFSVYYIPYENWLYQNLTFSSSTLSAPAHVSQDPQGKMVFYPQTLAPFRVNFIYTATPQILTLYSDVPNRLPAAFHEWIAWEALIMYALYDKNPDLAAHAQRMATMYSTRADNNLMPHISWAPSRF